jgi:hypothetical protein
MKRWVVAVAFVLVATACGTSGGGAAAVSPSPTPSPTPSPSPSPSPSGLSFKLNPVSTSTTASGTIRVVVGTGSVSIELAITGLQAASSHVSHIHLGSCAQRGSIAIALNQVVADGQGNADARRQDDDQRHISTGKRHLVRGRARRTGYAGKQLHLSALRKPLLVAIA